MIGIICALGLSGVNQVRALIIVRLDMLDPACLPLSHTVRDSTQLR